MSVENIRVSRREHETIYTLWVQQQQNIDVMIAYNPDSTSLITNYTRKLCIGIGPACIFHIKKQFEISNHYWHMRLIFMLPSLEKKNMLFSFYSKFVGRYSLIFFICILIEVVSCWGWNSTRRKPKGCHGELLRLWKVFSFKKLFYLSLESWKP